ncbi:MAG TPA: class I adenylate-forming enzyme family protein [Bradyrhizobium sp.]|nr:class I adenylate-forming enzyme family protein [Bradyrhizobium sp.]
MNLVDQILFQCRFQPAAPAIIVAGGNAPVSYRQLGQFIENVSRRARRQGIARGQVVALAFKDQLLHVACVLGLSAIGAVTVSAHHNQLPSALGIDVVLSEFPEQFGERRVITVSRGWLAEEDPSLDEPKANAGIESKYCRLILTSGTTGEPKAVALTYAQAITRVMRQQFVYGKRFADSSRIYVDVGISTVAGFSTLFNIFWRGGVLFLQGRDPVETLKALFANGIQAMVASPKGLSDLVELYDRMPGQFGKLDLIVSLGSVLDRRLLKRARAQLCHELHSVYGSTEHATVAVATSELLEKGNGVAGYVIGGAEVEIVDRNGTVLPPGTEGLVRTKGASAADGYVVSTLDRVEAFPEEGFVSGDLGVMTTDGYLVISGREGSIINLGGDKVSPEKIELALVDFPPVRDAGAFTLQTPLGIDRIVGAIVWNDNIDRDACRQELHTFLQTKLTHQYIPKLFVELERIPRNHMGKIDRPALKSVATEAIRKTQELSQRKDGKVQAAG